MTVRENLSMAGYSIESRELLAERVGEVLEMFGCEQDAIDFAHLDADLERAIDAALERAGETRARVIASRPAVEASSIAQFDALEGLLGSRARPVDGTRP